DALKPSPEAQQAFAAQFAIGEEVSQRIPEAQQLRIGFYDWNGLPGEIAVDDEIERRARTHQKLVSGREPRIDLDELELAVPRIAFELDIAEAAQTNRMEEIAAFLCRVRKPFRNVIAGVAAIDRVAAQYPLGEVKELAAVFADIGIVARQEIIGPGNHLHHHDFESERKCQAHFFPELVKAVLDDEQLVPERTHKLVRVDGLDEQREYGHALQCFKICFRSDLPEARRVYSGFRGKLKRLALVEKRALQLRVGAVENVAGGKLFTMIGHELNGIIAACEKNVAIELPVIGQQEQVFPKGRRACAERNGETFVAKSRIHAPAIGRPA